MERGSGCTPLTDNFCHAFAINWSGIPTPKNKICTIFYAVIYLVGNIYDETSKTMARKVKFDPKQCKWPFSKPFVTADQFRTPIGWLVSVMSVTYFLSRARNPAGGADARWPRPGSFTAWAIYAMMDMGPRPVKPGCIAWLTGVAD